MRQNLKQKGMKKKIINKNENEDVIPPFDFDNSKPNWFVKDYRPDSSIDIIQSERHLQVTIDDDLTEYFPDEDSVNKALRGLINIIPKLRIAR